MSAPWPRHSLWEQDAKVCLGHHSVWRNLILRVGMGSLLGNSHFAQGGSIFLGLIFLLGWVTERVGFSLGVGQSYSLPGGGASSLRGEGYFQRWGWRVSVIIGCGLSFLQIQSPVGWSLLTRMSSLAELGGADSLPYPGVPIYTGEEGLPYLTEDSHWRRGPPGGPEGCGWSVRVTASRRSRILWQNVLPGWE